MRLVKAGLKESFWVHRTINEFQKDCGRSPVPSDRFNFWMNALNDESRQFILVMHSKKVVGMVWGHESYDGSFVVDGRFLRRAHRGKMRFTKYLRKAMMEMIKGYDTILVTVPKGRDLSEIRPYKGKGGKKCQ